MSKSYFFCISAGQTITRKKKTPFSLKHRYLNYGLLSLATILKEQNIPAIQVQGLFESPRQTLQVCIEELNFLDSEYPLFLSIPSFYALDWSIEFINLIYQISVHDKFHRTLILSGFCLLKIAKISLNSSFFPKPIKR